LSGEVDKRREHRDAAEEVADITEVVEDDPLPPSNGLGAQLRPTAPPMVAEAPKLNARRLPNPN
jgi:hypothetical protein